MTDKFPLFPCKKVIIYLFNGVKNLRRKIEIATGFDTTASTISWALYSLAQHPHYQKLCQEEIDGLTEGRNDEPITWFDWLIEPYNWCEKYIVMTLDALHWMRLFQQFKYFKYL